MLKPQKGWGTRDTAVLMKLVARGWQSPAIARIMKRTPQSVRNKVRHLGLKLKRGGTGRRPNAVAKMAAKSDRLRDRINALLATMPASVRAAVLCPQPKAEPGTERIRKTAEIERLAA